MHTWAREAGKAGSASGVARVSPNGGDGEIGWGLTSLTFRVTDVSRAEVRGSRIKRGGDELPSCYAIECLSCLHWLATKMLWIMSRPFGETNPPAFVKAWRRQENDSVPRMRKLRPRGFRCFLHSSHPLILCLECIYQLWGPSFLRWGYLSGAHCFIEYSWTLSLFIALFLSASSCILLNSAASNPFYQLSCQIRPIEVRTSDDPWVLNPRVARDRCPSQKKKRMNPCQLFLRLRSITSNISNGYVTHETRYKYPNLEIIYYKYNSFPPI